MALPVLDCCSWHPCAKVLVGDVHHIQPLAWGGPDIPSNRRRICTNVHRLCHTLLNRYKKLGGPPPWSERQHYNALVRSLAQQGWDAMVATKSMTVQDIRRLPDL